MEPTTPTELRSLHVPGDNPEKLARRLFSCPACGCHWVLNAPDGVQIAGVRGAGPGDPAGTALVCELCLTCVDCDGGIVRDSPAN